MSEQEDKKQPILKRVIQEQPLCPVRHVCRADTVCAQATFIEDRGEDMPLEPFGA